MKCLASLLLLWLLVFLPAASQGVTFTCDSGCTPPTNLDLIDTALNDKNTWKPIEMDVDGAQCSAAAATTVNSLPMTTIQCLDNAASAIYGSQIMSDAWDGGTITFTLWVVQTDADTNNLQGDISALCRGDTDTLDTTFGTPIAMDSAMTGLSAIDTITSAAVTPNGTCAAGDMLVWKWLMDDTGTDTAVGTLHFLGMRLNE